MSLSPLHRDDNSLSTKIVTSLTGSLCKKNSYTVSEGPSESFTEWLTDLVINGGNFSKNMKRKWIIPAKRSVK